jgi:hypothetical protein
MSRIGGPGDLREQAFLAVERKSGPGQPVAGQHCGEQARAPGIGAGGRLPHRKFADAGLHQRDIAGCGDGDRIGERVLVELQQRAGGDGRRNRSEDDVVPAALARADRIGEPAMHLIAADDGVERVGAAAPESFRQSQHHRDVVARMHRLLRQVDVVVVEIAGGDAVDEARRSDGGMAFAAGERSLRQGRIRRHGLERQGGIACAGDGLGFQRPDEAGHRVDDAARADAAHLGGRRQRPQTQREPRNAMSKRQLPVHLDLPPQDIAATAMSNNLVWRLAP